MIQAHGSSSASYFLIGDGASATDLKSNYALSGGIETTLKQILGPLNFGESWRTLLIKDSVNITKPESYVGKVEEYLPYLIDEIETIRPYILIPLNEVVFNVLATGKPGKIVKQKTGDKISYVPEVSIRKYRGSIMEVSPLLNLSQRYKIMPILGPVPYLFSEFHNRWISQIDFGKVPQYFNREPLPVEKVWIAKTAAELRAFLQRSYSDDGLLVFDIETFMGMPTCISFCFDSVESVCIPFMDKSIDMDNRVMMLHLVAKTLASPIRKANQNIKYDLKCLERFNFRINNVTDDTQIAASCLTPELAKNLGFLVSLYTDMTYFKDEGKQWDPSKPRSQYYIYNAKDSLGTRRVLDKQQEEIDEVGCREVYTNMCKLIPIYKQMEYNGLLYDDAVRLRLLAKYTSLYNIHVLKVRNILNEYAFNPQSPKQVERVVYEVLGFTKNRLAKDTSEKSLEHLYVFGEAKRSPIYGKIVLEEILNCRKIHKVIEYLDTYPYPDGVWRCEYRLGGTETGRTSAGKSTDQIITWIEQKTQYKAELVNLGRSFQTIGKHGFMIDGQELGRDLREMFVPRPGYTYVEIDASQAEARVDTVLAGNFDFLKVFDGPIGVHKLTGSWVFECDPSEIKKNTIVQDPVTGIATDRYHLAKTVRHAGERNIKAGTLVLLTQQPQDFCEKLLYRFHDKQPEIRLVFHADIRKEVMENRALQSPNGRIRQFLGPMDDRLINEAISQLPQAIVSDMVKFSLIPTTEELGEHFKLINEAHDGTLAEVKDEYVEKYIETYIRNVEKPIDFRKGSIKRDFELVIPSEASTSKTNWLDMKDWK